MANKYWDQKWVKRRQVPVNNFARRAYKLVQAKRFKTLLDLGCGIGQDAVYFASKGLSVTAVDISKSGIALLKSNQINNLKCLEQDLSKIKFLPNSFNVVYAHLSLHYFDNQTTQKIFQQIYKWLKPGGYLFVKCKSVDDAIYGKGKKIGSDLYIKEGVQRHFFSKAYLAKNLAQFKIIKLRKTASTYHAYKSAFIEAVAKK